MDARYHPSTRLADLLKEVTWKTNMSDHNKQIHCLNGNRPSRSALKVGHWNCNKGLLNALNFPTDKIHEIANFISMYDLDMLAVS